MKKTTRRRRRQPGDFRDRMLRQLINVLKELELTGEERTILSLFMHTHFLSAWHPENRDEAHDAMIQALAILRGCDVENADAIQEQVQKAWRVIIEARRPEYGVQVQ